MLLRSLARPGEAQRTWPIRLTDLSTMRAGKGNHVARYYTVFGVSEVWTYAGHLLSGTGCVQLSPESILNIDPSDVLTKEEGENWFKVKKD